MRLNIKVNALTEKTHEGAPAYGNLTPYQQLRRSLLSCFLWEKEFYEDGKSISDRIFECAVKVDPKKLAALAIEARTQYNLRHAPLLLLLALAKTGSGTSLLSETLPKVVLRADEMGELISLYWKEKKKPLSAQLKKGLAKAFLNFDAYQLAKYNRDVAVKVRDVMFLTHPRPTNAEDVDLYKKVAEDKLDAPDTWEVALSAGADKKETFERLLKERKLGYLALLRNLRNMEQAGVDRSLISDGLEFAKGFEKVLPFRFVAAARACLNLEPLIDKALLRKIDAMRSLKGKTAVLVDVSGSMDVRLSSRSDMMRIDAAAALSSIIKSDELFVFSFSDSLVALPPRRGMAGVDAVINSQSHKGTRLGEAVETINARVKYDRLIVISDEQSHSRVGNPNGRGYMINVASNKNGVGYGPWVHVDGFSEKVIDFIYEYENYSSD